MGENKFAVCEFDGSRVVQVMSWHESYESAVEGMCELEEGKRLQYYMDKIAGVGRHFSVLPRGEVVTAADVIGKYEEIKEKTANKILGFI
jgi:hypothetical protein